ncbi:uncharacterized protein LOC144159928 [Haemaphysalis longicornis]
MSMVQPLELARLALLGTAAMQFGLTVGVQLNAREILRKLVLSSTTCKEAATKLQRDFQKLLSDVFRCVPPHNKYLYYRLLCHSGSAPALYGLPKTHKPEVPIRTIFDYTRSPFHKLPGYLRRVLRPLVGNSATHVLHSGDFIDKARDIPLEGGDILVSFDVQSLFTSIPTGLAVDACVAAHERYTSLPERTPTEVPDLRRLLKFCFENTYFTFDNLLYKQVHGTAMCAAVSVTAANLTMESLEERALNSFRPAPKTSLRYVDDCFSTTKQEALTAFTAHLNSMDDAIRFTVEKEQHGEPPFLDVLVKCEGKSLTCSVYRKSANTGRYLHFTSVKPGFHKRSVITSLVSRAKRVCKKPDDVAADLQHVHRDRSASGYTDSVVRSVERQLERPALSGNTRPNSRGPIPYVHGISEHLARVLCLYSLQVAHVPTQKLRHSLVNVKDKLTEENFLGVVYSIPCAD